MRLKTIKIQGFKSFPDAIEVQLKGSFISLVGPNGCGKSNIIDAIRFAMGEQSPKSLRAEKMVDLIFSGNEKRKPLSMAEVTLCFENAESLGISDELVVSRKIYRDGGSSYLINGREVRLKDMERLFLGTGIGKNSFYHFEQGKLDEIMRFGAKERRSFFDETAGISRFLDQKKEALAKLLEIAGEYSRLDKEYELSSKRLSELRAEAAQASAFLEKKKRFEEVQKLKFSFQYREKKKRELKLKEEFERLSSLILKEEEKLKKLEKEIDLDKKSLNELYNLLAQEEKRELELAGFEKIFALELKQMQEKEELNQKWEKRLKEEIDRIQKGQAEADLEKEALLAAVKERESREKDFSKPLDDPRLKKLEEAEFQAIREKDKLTFILKNIEEQLDQKERALREVQKKHINKAGEIAKKEAFIEKKKSKKGEYDKEIESLWNALEGQKQKLDEVIGLKNEAKRKEDELRILLKLRKEKEKEKDAALEILEGAKSKKNPLFGKIFQSKALSNHPLYQKTLILKKIEDLSSLIAYAEKEGKKDFSFVIEERGFELGEFKNFSLRHSLLKEVDLGGEGFSNEGLFLDSKGVFHYFGKERGDSRQIAELESALSAEEERRISFEKMSQIHESERLALEEKRRSIEVLHLEANFQVNEHALSKKKEEGELLLLQKEIDLIERAKEKIKKEMKEAKENLEKAALFLLECRKTLNEEGVEISEKKRKWEKEREIYLFTLARDKEKISTLSQLKAEKEKEVQKKKKELEVTSLAALKIKEEIQKKCDESKSSSSQKKELHEKLERTREKLAEVKKSFSEKEKRFSEENKAFQKAKLGKDEIEREKGSLQKEIESILIEMEPLGIAEPLEIKENVELKEIENELRELKKYLGEGFSLNFSSIEILKSEEERYGLLEKNFLDLKSAKDDLEKIIHSLEEKSRDQFMQTFEEIRKSFQSIFSRLFIGGKADLILVGDKDPLLAGVEIIAQPSGQKMKTMTLLSGGERCLTALALLFALFEIRSAPFSLMDEVDAPLDEANIERFTNLLSQFINNTQFVMVTHNKKTMACADLLIGVSMEEKGVSKLLFLEFQKQSIAKAEV